MWNFILGITAGIVLILLLIYVIGKLDENNIREQIGEDFEYVLIPKSKSNIKQYVRICFSDDAYTAMHLDDDKNIIAFMSFSPKNIEAADFYYSMFNSKQIIKILYNNKEYEAVITEIKLIDTETLRIYYKVI